MDIRQVNTTRFSLFTPETRDFFLQDVAAFEFGGRNFGRSVTDRESNNGRPFFSRNIGLTQGVPVSLIVGNKLSGQYAGFDIGALSVLTDETPTSGGQVLSVLRVTRPVFGESKIGFIVTNGSPTGLSGNTVARHRFPIPQFNLPRPLRASGRRVLPAQFRQRERAMTTRLRSRSISRMSHGGAIS